ncbi:MAG: error-prone DNA polymerase [Pseudolysinimonas sp.]|uniref:error-prone DNA polymerase n=1 Tax=Pseudolysinimonas sp. TaxID=2680009 RepID=UPI003266333F
MGWHNPPHTWSELERRMSGKGPIQDGATWNNRRPKYEAPEASGAPESDEAVEPLVPYAELHVHSAYSFLDGASMPEHLVEEAKRLRLEAIALTDHDGFYGAVRFAEAAQAHGMSTIYGAELSLGLSKPQNGIPDPEGAHLVVLARGQEGYHRLSKALTRGHLQGGEKGRPRYDLDELGDTAEGHWVVLSGCRKGTVRQALEVHGLDGAKRELTALTERFGRDNVVVELTDRGDPLDSDRNATLATLARDLDLAVLATGNVHYARPEQAPLASALAAVRARASLDQHDPWLPAAGGAYLRSGHEMSLRFARYPDAVARSVVLARELAFELRSVTPRLPQLDVPEGYDLMGWLRHETWAAAALKYPNMPESHRRRIQNELDVIAVKDFPGYFLLVKDIVDFARSRGILCQGRGSAASSAVCYLLGITAIDAIYYELPFERFLSSIREEEPDIDVDFDSDRREEVIQYVYEKYGRENAAQVANVVTYTPRNAIRDIAKAFGHGPGQQDAWSKRLERWGDPVEEDLQDIPIEVRELSGELLGFPRHLGIHSGGMVMTERPIGEVVPIEHARMKDRTVLQWEKDDCKWMGLVKFDLLGLGMLSALQHSFDCIRDTFGRELTLATIPKEEAATYDALCRAEAIGVFQVESRAQMGLLPRLQPRCFYDLVIQIALIRPGPIQGGAVHPFVRRKLGEKFEFLHPDLEPILGRTFGVPVFQEQVIKIARDLAGLDPEEADLLRRALGSKRGYYKIGLLREKLEDGLRAKGLDDDGIATIYGQIEAFANFGFAESHALSFALLVYASSWLKLHYPGAFLAGLLRAQPMGFYSPATLVADTRRHGVEVRRPDIHRSGVFPLLEPWDETGVMGVLHETGTDDCLGIQAPVEVFDATAPDLCDQHRRDGGAVVRLGLAGVRGIGETVARRIVAEREARGAFTSMENLVRRVGLSTAQLEALASADAFEGFDLDRREALWRAGAAAGDRAEFLPSTVVTVQPPLFADPTSFEILRDDLWATGISVDDHPVAHLRSALDERGVLPSSALRTHEPGRRVEVAGLVTHRQRPGTASGITFMNLEDEHGSVNVICSVGVWKRYRRVARESPALLVRGILERSPEGVTNLVADCFESLSAGVLHRSRDFH